MTEQDLIAKLKAKHKAGSSSPMILCSSTFKEFDYEEGKEWPEIQSWQSELFMLCKVRGDTWTKW